MKHEANPGFNKPSFSKLVLPNLKDFWELFLVVIKACSSLDLEVVVVIDPAGYT
jgi:hypothetical protein